ncbi:MAG: 4-hydroxy-tetrahydrodipicolinate reductase [Opitutales bacterium]
MSTKILLNGFLGRMGQAIIEASEGSDCEIAVKIDEGYNAETLIDTVDAVIDFSTRDATLAIVELCAKYKKPIVIGTTGHSNEQRTEILQYTKQIPMVWAGNYSIGVNLLNYLTKLAAKILPDSYDIEITEMHHKFKKDAPSGTATKLMKVCQDARDIPDTMLKFGREGITGERPVNEIGVHALRGGSVIGDHTVIFAGDSERVELSHFAGDRKIFAIGALRAAKWVVSKTPDLYEMEDVLELK